MIISLSAYYTICGLVAFAAIFPILYGRMKKMGNKYDWTWIFILILIPINWFTPAIYEVEGCGNYTKKILIAPNEDYSLGEHNYIINNSDSDLFFEFIGYGNFNHDKIGDDVIIGMGTSYKAPIISIDYVFETAPKFVNTKKDGEIRTRLSCDIPELEELDEENVEDVVISIESEE